MTERGDGWPWCYYCIARGKKVRQTAVCQACGAGICENHETPDGECQTDEACPLHPPRDLDTDEWQGGEAWPT